MTAPPSVVNATSVGPAGSASSIAGTVTGVPVAASSSRHTARRTSAAPSGASSASAGFQQRDRRNWFLYQLYVRQEYPACISLIESQLRETGGTCEYALYLKGLLKRQEGKLTESLQLLEASVLVNPLNIVNRKQLGRALMLLGKHKQAIDVFEEVNVRRMVASEADDWETFHCIGICYTNLRDYAKAIEALSHAVEIQKNDATFLRLAEAFALINDYDSAIAALKRALAGSPENPKLLSKIGQYYLQKGDAPQAFDSLGRCLAIDPSNAGAITCAASMIQEAGDYDVALSKYRVAVSKKPSSPHVWNNIGACFYGKKKYYAALACLRKAQFLRPFEWIIHYNSGLVHLSMGRYVSAFHSLSTAINLNTKKSSSLYMYLGVCLSLMNDIENACSAYERAISLSDAKSGLLCRLNYTVTLFNSNMIPEAQREFAHFMNMWRKLSPSDLQEQPPQLSFIVSELDRSLGTGKAA